MAAAADKETCRKKVAAEESNATESAATEMIEDKVPTEKKVR